MNQDFLEGETSPAALSVIDRRGFLKQCGMLCGAALVLPMLNACEPSSFPIVDAPDDGGTGADGRLEVDVSNLAVMSAILVRSGGRSILISRTSETQFYALSNICTHQGTAIPANLQNGHFVCPLHQSVFDLDGSRLAGLAELPLPRYDIEYFPAENLVRVTLP